jgi:hypothetical protein
MALVAASAACRSDDSVGAAHGPAAVQAPTPESLADVEARLDGMLKAASRCTSDAECRTVPVGGKACGGPTGYRAYSTKGADPAAVEALAQKEHELAMAEARASGRVSNCMILADPGAACVQGQCVTAGPNAPRGAVTR